MFAIQIFKSKRLFLNHQYPIIILNTIYNYNVIDKQLTVLSKIRIAELLKAVLMIQRFNDYLLLSGNSNVDVVKRFKHKTVYLLHNTPCFCARLKGMQRVSKLYL